ncbi:MAG: hypothetical protein D6736_11930 [Nitrospinota bacterium]|nr:MAG: hypothetical protein D6736_11930 [Nitrospinota bacterium]
MQKRWRYTLRFLGILLALGLVACSAFPPFPPPEKRAGEGRFLLYLNGPSKTPFAITVELASLDVEREDGARFSLLSHPLRLHSLEIVGGQLLLAETFLPEGRYTALLARIRKAQLSQEGKTIDLALPKEAFRFNTTFTIRPGEVTPLFMTWEVEGSIERETIFHPAFLFAGKSHAPRGVLAYVSNEGSDTVSVIDRATDQVISVLAVGEKPRGIVVAPDSSRAFVVNAASHTLTVLDVNTSRVLHTINLELGGNPSDLAITPDGQTLYVVNTALNTVSVVSATSFQLIQTIPVGQRPVAVAITPQGDRLLVVNSASNTISVIDTFRNQVMATIAVDFRPSDVAIDLAGTQAFVSHLGSPQLALLSLPLLRVTQMLNAGPAAAVLPDEVKGRVFLAQSHLQRVSVFDTVLNSEIDAVTVGKAPHYLALDPDRGKLYVVNQGSDSVTVIDTASRQVKATIPVGKRPYAMAIVR